FVTVFVIWEGLLMKIKIIVLLSIFPLLTAIAQEQVIIGNDTLVNQSVVTGNSSVYKQLIVPTALVGYGLIGLADDGIKDVNEAIKSEVNGHEAEGTSIDDYPRYVPLVSVYALNLLGVKR